MLTDEQKKIAEENHNLIYYFIRKYNVDLEEFYDLFAIDYLKCIKVWDKNKSKLTALVGKALLNRVLLEKRKRKASIVSLSTPTIKDEDITLEDILKDKTNIEKIIEDKETLEFLTQCEVTKMKMLGYSQKEIANKFNISQSYVSRKITVRRKELEKNNRKGETYENIQNNIKK